MRDSLPRLRSLSEEYRDQGDRFAVIAFHDATVKSFAELDAKLKSIEANVWGGKPLPVPILLDATGETLKRYDIRAFPTAVLIDPGGKIVDTRGTERLEKILKDGRK